MPALSSRPPNRSTRLLLAGIFLAAALLPPVQPAGAQTTPGVTLSAAPERLETIVSAQAWSGSPALSAAGSVLAFASAAPLSEGDENDVADIYVYETGKEGLRRASVSSQGQPSDGWSYAPAISTDGRIVAFTSLATTLGAAQSIPRAQVYAHDLTTGKTSLVSKTPAGEPAQGWSTDPSLSADGRYVAFTSLANDLSDTDPGPGADVFLHDRRTGKSVPVSIAPQGEQAQGWSAYPALSADARWVAFIHSDQESAGVWVRDLLRSRTLSLASLPGFPGRAALSTPAVSADGEAVVFAAGTQAGDQFGVVLYERSSGQIILLPGSQAAQASFIQYAISPEGRFVAYRAAAPGEEGAISVYDRQTQTTQALLLSEGSPLSSGGDRLALAAHGASLAFAHAGGISLSRDQASGEPARFVAGWVSDEQGYPLAGVELRDEWGRTVKTDAAGRFRLEGLRSGVYTLTPSKKGYTFTPETRQARASDQIWPSLGQAFTAVPTGILEAGLLDIGMPYSTNRGCPTPWKGCGGPFSGFYAGDCTDLILDAFNAGADYNIQHAMERDARLHPSHYYRWRDVRSAHDMWRFFAYSGQMLPASTPYLPGDIVFFDWEEDGIVDHVALISEVTAQGRPRRMLDATGKISENPEGLAIDLEWKSYHRDRSVGHARWNGLHFPPGPADSGSGPQLLANVDSYHVGLRLLDMSARTISAETVDLAGGSYHSLNFSEVISLFAAGRETETFFLELRYEPAGDEISSPAQAPYQLGIQAAHDGQVTQNQVTKGVLERGQALLIPVSLRLQDGKLRFTAELP